MKVTGLASSINTRTSDENQFTAAKLFWRCHGTSFVPVFLIEGK